MHPECSSLLIESSNTCEEGGHHVTLFPGKVAERH